ncbi:hypothetical protein ACOMHN_041707 [Nucella lapillus]
MASIQTTGKSTTDETTTESVSATTTTPQSTTCQGAVNSYPSLPGSLEIITAILSTKVRFDCKFSEAEAGSVYHVTWTSGSAELRNITLTGGVMLDSFDSATLTQAQRQSVISDGITCAVRVANPARCGNGISPPYSASLDRTRLTVSKPSQTVLTALTETKIDVSFTSKKSSEFYCLLVHGQTCSVVVEVKTQQTMPWKCLDGSTIPSMSVKSLATTAGLGNVCGTQVSSSSSQAVVLRPAMDNIVRQSVNVTVDLIQVDFVGSQRLTEKTLEVFTFTVESSVNKVSSCRIFGDPHIRTFDGLAYDVMRQGSFLVYRHKQLDIEVEGFFLRTGFGASACGFAIRSGDDVFRVSKCTPGSSFTPTLFLNGELTAHTKIFQEDNGSRFTVFLPTGAVVTIIDVDDIVHAVIRPSALDEGQTEGLCGTYDGDSSNDLTSRTGQLFTLDPDKDPVEFSKTWRVPGEASLYGGFVGTATSDFSQVYCSCERGSSAACTNFGFVAECGTSLNGEDITERLVNDNSFTQTLINRRRRQATNTREVFTFDPNFNASESATWPTASGVTEQQAKTYCENAIKNSPAYSKCTQFSADDFNTEIKSCVRDIKLTDKLYYSNASIQAIQDSCSTNLAVNSSTWTDPSPGVKDSAATPDYTIANTLCPKQCSGHGTCVNGACKCESNYGSSDCSFEIILAPTVVFAGSNTLCQSNTAACNRTIVRGDNFLKGVGGGLTCHITPIAVKETGIQYEGQTLQVPATYRSQSETLCNLPEARSYAIRISNDKKTTSFNEALYVVYNSQCFVCLIDSSSTKANCTAKTSTCLIDGQCYINGDTHPTNPCLQCSSSSYDSWSSKSVAQCPTSTTMTTTTKGREDPMSKRFNTETIIIAASVSSVLVVLVIIGIAVYIIRRRQQRAVRKELTRESDEGSSYDRVYNGSYGVRTQKALAFRNPTRVYDYYEPTL